MSYDEQERRILAKTKWETIHDHMKSVHWTWRRSQTPSIDELKNEAKHLMRQAWHFMEQQPQEPWFSVSCGGFCVFINRTLQGDLKMKLSFDIA